MKQASPSDHSGFSRHYTNIVVERNSNLLTPETPTVRFYSYKLASVVLLVNNQAGKSALSHSHKLSVLNSYCNYKTNTGWY